MAKRRLRIGKDFDGWVITNPHGHVCMGVLRKTREGCITDFTKHSTTVLWKDWYRGGFRCERVVRLRKVTP